MSIINALKSIKRMDNEIDKLSIKYQKESFVKEELMKMRQQLMALANYLNQIIIRMKLMVLSLP